MTSRTAAIVVVLILTACGSTMSTETPLVQATPDPPETPAVSSPEAATPSPYADLMPDDVLLLRANTNLWSVQEERTVTVPASVVLYADGLVIADVNPTFEEREWRAIELTPEELETLAGTIAATRPREAQLAGEATCADCGVTVIQARATDGELVEMAVAGLYTEDPDVPLPGAVTPSMVALSRALHHLQFLAERRKEVATTRVVPQVPASAVVGG